MNGPGYAIWAVDFAAGVFMVAAWVLRRRRRRFRPSPRQLVFRIALLVAWLRSLVFIPAVARAGSQPGPELVVQIVLYALVMNGVHDLRGGRSREPSGAAGSSPYVPTGPPY
jgi:hypothetical protein